MAEKISGDWSVRDLPQAKYRLKCPNSMAPVGICIHNTAMPAPASNEISYMQTNNTSTSFHFAVDEKEAIQGLPLNRNGWHAGDGNGQGNRKHIGIEIARSTDQTPGRFAMAEKRTAAVCAKLLGRYGWGLSNIKAHRDFASKNCPHRTSMTNFKNLVSQALGGKLTGDPNQNTPAPPVDTSLAGKVATVTCDVLNVRSGPGTGNSILGSLKRGQSVTIKGESSGWLNVNYSGKNAFISKQYVSIGNASTPTPAPAPAPAPIQSNKTATVTCDVLNVRSGPGTGNSILGTLKKGQNVPVKGESGGWLNITYNGRNAYISKQYASVKSGGSAPAPAPVQSNKTATVTCSVLNVRSGPGTGNSILGTLKKGQSVPVKGESNGWLNITYNGRNAYISKQYASVKSGGGSSPAPAPAPTKTATVTCDVLNVRTGAGTGYRVLGTLKKGQSVSVKGEASGWLNITFNGQNAYISKQYTSLKSSGGSTTPAPAPTKTARVTCSALNVRAGAGTGYRIIGSLSNGQTVTVKGDSGGWLNITYNGMNGFISKQYTSLGSSGGNVGGGGGAVGANGVPLYAQGDPKWGSRRLGRNCTIASHGCAMTSTAMAISKIGGRQINPAQLDQYLDNNGGYSGDSIYWNVAARMIGRSANALGMNRSVIDRELNAGRPVVISVKSQGHWVCIAGRRSNGSYIIHDPAGGRVKDGSWNGWTVVVSGYSTGNQLRTF